MKKIKVPKYSIFAFVCFGVLLIPYIILRVLELSDTYIYAFGTDSERMLPNIAFGLLVFGLSGVAVLVCKNAKRKKLAIILSVILIFLVLCFQAIHILHSLTKDSIYFEFISDNNEHQIIVKEDAWLLSGFGDVYEKNSDYTMKKVGHYTTDDGYRPFSNNTYYFVWNENDFELHYDMGTGLNEYNVEKMKYAK